MVKRVLLSSLLCLAAVAASAEAQVRIEASVLGGYSWAEGVTGKDFFAPNGQTYNAADPSNSGHFGFMLGVTEGHGEYGFLYRRKMGEFLVSGSATTTVGDLNTDNYHGYFAYYFGDPDKAVHLFVLAGAGMTHYSTVKFTSQGQTVELVGRSEFSPVLGTGVRLRFANNFGARFGINWTPTYLTMDEDKMWCDPYWGCYLSGNPQYSNQVDFFGAFTFRFGGK